MALLLLQFRFIIIIFIIITITVAIAIIIIIIIIIRHHTNVALLLLHSGADFDLPDSEGETPIHICAREGMLGLSQVGEDAWF